jgi:hypothetical protein
MICSVVISMSLQARAKGSRVLCIVPAHEHVSGLALRLFVYIIQLFLPSQSRPFNSPPGVWIEIVLNQWNPDVSRSARVLARRLAQAWTCTVVLLCYCKHCLRVRSRLSVYALAVFLRSSTHSKALSPNFHVVVGLEVHS